MYKYRLVTTDKTLLALPICGQRQNFIKSPLTTGLVKRGIVSPPVEHVVANESSTIVQRLWNYNISFF